MNESEVKVGTGPKQALGSCNGCRNGSYKLDLNGRPLVTEVNLRGNLFRLCASCLVELKKQL